MAEFVQRSIEDLVTVFELLKHSQLFTDDETRSVIKKVKQHEHKLQKRVKDKMDFVNYAKYLIAFLELVHERRRQHDYWFKKLDIDGNIVRKIDGVFRRACLRFQNDKTLWQARIEFAKKRNSNMLVEKIYLRMLAVHPNDEEIWISAVDFQVTELKSFENGRKLLQKALRFLSSSVRLWTKLFELELDYMQKINDRNTILTAKSKPDEHDEQTRDNNNDDDAVIGGKLAILVFEEGCAKTSDIDIYKAFLSIVGNFKCAEHVEDLIHSKMKKCLEQDETFVSLEADYQFTKRLRKSNIDDNEQYLNAVFCAFGVFEDYLSQNISEQVKSSYLKFALDRMEQCQSIATRKMLIKKIQLIINDVHIDDDELKMRWLKVSFGGTVSETKELLEQLIKSASSDINAWMFTLEKVITMMTKFDVFKYFDEALKFVPQKESLPIWLLAFDFIVEHDQDRIVKFIQVLQHVDDRQFYESAVDGMIKIKPTDVSFYVQLIQNESKKFVKNDEFVARCFEYAICDHGNDSPDIWLSYIEFLNEKHLLQLNAPVYNRALKYLKPNLIEQFLENYAIHNQTRIKKTSRKRKTSPLRQWM